MHETVDTKDKSKTLPFYIEENRSRRKIKKYGLLMLNEDNCFPSTSVEILSLMVTKNNTGLQNTLLR